MTGRRLTARVINHDDDTDAPCVPYIPEPVGTAYVTAPAWGATITRPAGDARVERYAGDAPFVKALADAPGEGLPCA